MGINVNVSKPVDIKENEWLRQFVSKTHIPAENEKFWEEILQFTIKNPNSIEEQLSLDSRLENYLESFIQNNLTSGNCGSLINVFLKKSQELLSLNQDNDRYVKKKYQLHVINNCVLISF